MQRRAPSATSALLQKANSQLKGERIKKPEDELDAYISSLTQKTSQQKKSVNFEDLGESISISSDIEDAPLQAKTPVVSSTGSKFLKKKTAVSDEAESSPSGKVKESSPGVGGASKFLKTGGQLGDAADLGVSGNKFMKKRQTATASSSPSIGAQARGGSAPAGARPVQSGVRSRQGQNQGQISSALQKASALTGKIQQKAVARNVVAMESDSDESFNLRMAQSVGDLATESLTSESGKIGKDGGKFLKKSAPTPSKPTPVQSTEPPQKSVTQKAPSKTSKTEPQQKKASPYQLKSSLKYSTEVVLNSEEESLAEYMEGLPSSSGDSFEKFRRQGGKQGRRQSPSQTPARQGKRSPSPPPPAKQSGRHTPVGQRRSPSPTSKPPPVRRTPSPSPRASPHLRKRSPSPKMMRSMSDDSNVADSLKSEIADDYDLGVNSTSTETTPRIKKRVVIMDLDELAPADEPTPAKTRDDSPFRSSVRTSGKENQKPRKSALKSTTKDIAVKDYPKLDSKSPFRASDNIEKSPFKASKDSRDSSPFKAKQSVEESPFKAKSSDSPFKSKSKTEPSPFSAKSEPSPFKPKAADSPFKATRESSPFKANEGSVFKSSARSSSSFKASDRDRPETGSPFKASDRDRSETGSPFKPKKDKSGRKSPFQSKNKENKRSKKKQTESRKKKNKKEKNDIFASLGIQTVEDLLGDSLNVGGDSVKVSEFESVASDLDQDRSVVSEEIKTEKPSVYSYARDEDSASEVMSEVESVKQSGPASYTEDFDSISEQIGVSTVHDRRYTSLSEVKTRYSGDDTAVDDYTEFSESDTETVTSGSDHSERSYTYTSYTDDYSRSLVRTSTDLTPLPPSGMKTAEAQTMFESGGLHYQWDPFATGFAFPGIPMGLGFVDPTPIATHMVSADALEAMTAYSPAMLALQDMLKAQLELTREFLQNQDRLYKEYTSDIQPNYHYTTLEDTKQYIKKHKKKKLTFKEALKLVDQEMGR